MRCSKNLPVRGRFRVGLVLGEGGLALLFLDFVAAEVFLRLGEDDVLAQNRIVFAQAEFVGGVHGIFLGVIRTNTRFFRDQADELTLGVILFCHHGSFVARKKGFVN